MKIDEGPEGKEDCAASIGGIFFPVSAGLGFRIVQRGQEKKNFGRTRRTPPAPAEERPVPHDCKQSDFSFGTLESLSTLKIPIPWPSTNLEMILK